MPAEPTFHSAFHCIFARDIAACYRFIFVISPLQSDAFTYVHRIRRSLAMQKRQAESCHSYRRIPTVPPRSLPAPSYANVSRHPHPSSGSLASIPTDLPRFETGAHATSSCFNSKIIAIGYISTRPYSAAGISTRYLAELFVYTRAGDRALLVAHVWWKGPAKQRMGVRSTPVFTTR